MKRTIISLLLFGLSVKVSGQSISLEPSGFQLPRLANNPACTTNDKGKQIYNTTLNKVLYCNGSAWVNPESGGAGGNTIMPAFRGYYYGNKLLTIYDSIVELATESYDLTNSLTLNVGGSKANRFTAPEAGIYNVSIYGRLKMANFTPKSNTKVVLFVARLTPIGGYYSYAYFPIYTNDEDKYLNFTRSFEVNAGDELVPVVKVMNPANTGTISIEDIAFEGFMITKK